MFSKSKKIKKSYYLNYNFIKKIKTFNVSISTAIIKNKNKSIVILKNHFGEVSFVPYIFGTFLNDFFYFFFKNIKISSALGKESYLLFSLNSYFISNIKTINNSKFISLATANGSYCLKKNLILDYKLIIIILPSKKKKFLQWFNLCFIGRNGNTNWKYNILGNYKNSLILKKKQQVRGVAMNPVDHPHGGRTKTNKPEVSPWGWISKFSH